MEDGLSLPSCGWAEDAADYAPGGPMIDDNGLLLRGSAGRHPVVRELPRAEISSVQRVRGRIGSAASRLFDLISKPDGRFCLQPALPGVEARLAKPG